ncbi:hypothetical protein KI387_018473, partial [Taxus chinensis]
YAKKGRTKKTEKGEDLIKEEETQTPSSNKIDAIMVVGQIIYLSGVEKESEDREEE